MCMYGDKCCYIHPNIPCKYGIYCTRIGCSYSHPSGFNPGMGMYPNMMHPIPFMKHKAKHGPVSAGPAVTAAKPEAVSQAGNTQTATENKNENENANPIIPQQTETTQPIQQG